MGFSGIGPADAMLGRSSPQKLGNHGMERLRHAQSLRPKAPAPGSFFYWSLKYGTLIPM